MRGGGSKGTDEGGRAGGVLGVGGVGVQHEYLVGEVDQK